MEMFRTIILLMTLIILAACTGEPAEPTSTGEQPTQQETQVSSERPAELEQIRLPMGFIADPQYAPFYVAVEKGYYADAGFEVTFDYSFETDGLALVGAGELPFAIVSGEQVILARAQDLPVVYVFEWFQKYPIALISKEDTGIKEPSDLAGREIGLPGFFGASYVGYAGLLSAAGLSEDDVIATDIGFTQVENLLADQVEAVVGYANNEPFQLEAQGQRVNVIKVSDYTDMVANGLITNEKLLNDDPAYVTRFVQATMKGLEDTLADPDQAFEISKRYVEGLDDGRRQVLDASLDMWQSDSLGLSDLESWRQTEAALLSIGFLDAPLEDIEAAFTNDIVLQIKE